MRTTLVIDDDLIAAAKSIAEARSVSIGHVLSELARKGLTAPNPMTRRNGFPVFDVPVDAPAITPQDVKRAEEEE